MVVFTGLTAKGLMAIVLCWLYPWQLPSIISKGRSSMLRASRAFALFQALITASGWYSWPSVCARTNQARLPDKECVMLRCFFSGFILDSFLARDRHTKPDRLVSALNEPSLAVPVLQCRNWPYWNFTERALN